MDRLFKMHFYVFSVVVYGRKFHLPAGPESFFPESQVGSGADNLYRFYLS